MRILVLSLSKRLQHMTAHLDPTGSVLTALRTADSNILAVLSAILGEQRALGAAAGEAASLDSDLPAMTRLLAALPPSLGGLGLPPLHSLAQSGSLGLSRAAALDANVSKGRPSCCCTWRCLAPAHC